MSRQNVINWIRKLNQHYGLNIHLRMPNIDAKASADIYQGYIRLAKLKPLYDPRVIAHEYAHFLQYNGGQRHLSQKHSKYFETIYRECCLVLGVFAVPTKELRQQKWAEVSQLESEHQ